MYSLYTGFDFYSDGYAVVPQGKKYGVIDKKGKFLINPQFDFLVTPDFFVLANMYNSVVDESYGMALYDKSYIMESMISTANSNAKLAYTNAATYCTQCEVNGYLCKEGWYKVDLSKKVDYTDGYKNDGNDINNAFHL